MNLVQMKDNGITELYEVKKIMSVKTTDFADKIMEGASKVSFPHSSHIVASFDTKRINRVTYFWEENPQVRCIECDLPGRGDVSYNIHFPYQVFRVDIVKNAVVEVYAYIRNEPVESGDGNDKLYLMPLTNVWDNGKVCFRNIDLQTPGRIEDKVRHAINCFFGTVFNTHLRDVQKRAMPACVFSAPVPADGGDGDDYIMDKWELYSNRPTEEPWRLPEDQLILVKSIRDIIKSEKD